MRSKKETKLHHALITVSLMVLIMFVSIVKYDASPQIPLVFCCLVAGVVSLSLGYTWEELLEGMVKGITDSLEAILILLLIGILVGSWIACGTVPAMIYYGLQIVSPQFFMPATMIICALVAFAVGSWGTVGTVGLAFMGIGNALMIPAPVVAGAVISGAYMGEVISPLSDATNLCAAVVKINIFDIVKKMMPSGIFVCVASIALYAISGRSYISSDSDSLAQSVRPLLQSLGDQFNITPLALIPMVLMLAFILLRIPAIPAMLIGGICGMIGAVWLQKTPVEDIFTYAFSGYVSSSGNEMIDQLLTAGGLEDMLNSISLIIIAMGFGGIMKCSKQLEALVDPLVSFIHGKAGLVLLTVVSCIGMNALLPDQYLGISMPGQMYSDAYEQRDIPESELALALLGGGAITSPLIPWNTCGIFCLTILGVSPVLYARYSYFCLLFPVAVILLGFFSSFRRRTSAIGRS